MHGHSREIFANPLNPVVRLLADDRSRPWMGSLLHFVTLLSDMFFIFSLPLVFVPMQFLLVAFNCELPATGSDD